MASILNNFITGLEAQNDQPFQVGDPFTLEQQPPEESIFGNLPAINDDAEFVNNAPQGVNAFALNPPPVDPKILPLQKNAAQLWQQQAQQPQAGVQQIQAQNRQLLKPQTNTTSRYYTRQLYREMMKSRDPETRMQARLGLRIKGAPGAQGQEQYVSNQNKYSMSSTGAEAGPNAANWKSLFPNSKTA